MEELPSLDVDFFCVAIPELKRLLLTFASYLLSIGYFVDLPHVSAPYEPGFLDSVVYLNVLRPLNCLAVLRLEYVNIVDVRQLDLRRLERWVLLLSFRVIDHTKGL
jgi:hypothetical protein